MEKKHKIKIIAVIPARGGSKGIKDKNIIDLSGKPLIQWTIEQAKSSLFVDDVFVSTDSKKIEKVAKESGAKVIVRPKKISGDKATTESVLLHASKVLKNNYDMMVLLQCTSPIRFSYQIDEAIKKMIKEKSDSLLSGYINDRFIWSNGASINYDYKNRPRRQDKQWEFVENGSIYVFKKNILLQGKNRLGGKISQFEMPKWMSFEIDDHFDLELIRFLMRDRYINNIYKDSISKIKMIIFDVDGVFTDGSVYLNRKGEENLKFSRIDGKGIELLKNKGYKLGIISSENSEIVKRRMEKLGIIDVFLGEKNKLAAYSKMKRKYQLKDSEICFCGDDIQDLNVIKLTGFSACPLNSQDIIKNNVKYISSKNGGGGFVRDISNLILEK